MGAGGPAAGWGATAGIMLAVAMYRAGDLRSGWMCASDWLLWTLGAMTGNELYPCVGCSGSGCESWGTPLVTGAVAASSFNIGASASCSRLASSAGARGSCQQSQIPRR